MEPRERALPDADYMVRFNPEIAFTICYDDPGGRLLFVFEVGDDPKLIFLNRNPDGEASTSRRELALNRVKSFLQEKSFRVEVE